jgi:hypothetical protein
MAHNLVKSEIFDKTNFGFNEQRFIKYKNAARLIKRSSDEISFLI